jgi:type VI secretion system secreted protein VgrG
MTSATETAQAADFWFSIDGVDPLYVLRLEGTEGISELFCFHLTLTTQETHATRSGVVGKPATLTLSLGGEPRKIHGIISRFRQGASSSRYVVYHATLVPKVFALEHRVDARIFQDKSTPDIVKAVLEVAGVGADDYRLALEQDYAPREYCVQYRESDWAFISRLLEEEGIFYFFEQTDAGTRLVIADGASAHDVIGAPSAIPFRPASGALHEDHAVTTLESVEQMHAGKVTLRDYNFKNPSLALESASSASRHTDLEAFDYPGGYGAPSAGDRIARIRTEEKCAAGVLIEGSTNCARFASGAVFTLENHPFSDLNADYVITRMQHEGAQSLIGATLSVTGPPYAARFVAIPKGVSYRPPRVYPKPNIHVQTAIVVGPDGEEVHTDEHGRVKVQFHWDRLGEKNDKSSTWIRVSNAWAGGGYGAMFLPRVGHEVVVDFLDGDVDRPIIVGRVYHGTQVPPYGLPGAKTKSTLKTLSSPDGDAGNELCFEDKKGEEQVYIHAQKDLVAAVENDRKQTIGNDDALDVTGNRAVTVGGDESLTVDGDASVKRSKNYKLEVGQTYTLKVDHDVKETVGGNKTIEIQGEKFELTCGQSKVKVSQSGVEIEAMEVKVKGMTSATLEGQAQVDVKASGQVTVKGEGQVTVQASGMVQVKGAMVKVN